MSLRYATLILMTTALILPIHTRAGEYFQCNDMDHFAPEGSCTDSRAKTFSEAKHGSNKDNAGFTNDQIEMWAEPTVDSSGKMVSKLPPLPAMRFLSDPTPENAKTYMEWNKKRMEALEKSQNVLQAMSGQSQAQNQRIGSIQEIKSVEFYFSPGCPYSIKQAPVVEGLAKKIGYAKVRAFTSTGDPVLLKDFISKTGLKVKIYVSPEPFSKNKIEAVPVTIIETKDGRKILFEGTTDNFIGQPGSVDNLTPSIGQPTPQMVQGGKQCDRK